MWRLPGPERAFLAFAVAVAVFQNVPAVLPEGDLVDVATPFAVIGASALVLLALRARGLALGLALLAGIAYTSGQSIHLAANSIADERPGGRVAEVAYFWDERFGHIWWHLGWLGLLAACCLAERAAVPSRSWRLEARHAATALLLAFTLFTNTVEGQTWWLGLGAGALFCAWAARERRPLLITCALAFALDALFIAVWAIWHGGVPQFSDLGLV